MCTLTETRKQVSFSNQPPPYCDSFEIHEDCGRLRAHTPSTNYTDDDDDDDDDSFSSAFVYLILFKKV